ncbi:zinc finger, CCHC-type containing protein [Tanacetum coccineum]
MVNSMLSYLGLSQGFWGEAIAVVRLPNPKLKTLGERGIECIFVGYGEHSKAFRFYVIKPNESISINLIIESKDAIFDKNRFSSIPRPSQRSLLNRIEDIGGLVVPEEVTEEVVVQQPEPEHRKSKKNRTPKDFRPEFELYLIKGTRDEVFDQQSYCFNVEDDPKTFVEAMKSQDVAFWKEAINDEMDSIMENNTWVLANLHLDEEVYMNQPPGFIMPGNENKVCKLIKSLYGLKQAPKQWHQKFDEVVLFGGYLLNQADKCVYSKFDESDTSEKLMPNNGHVVSQLKYSRVIGCLMYTMTYTRPDIAFAMGKLSSLTYTGYPSVLEGYTNASWINNTKNNSSISGWVFLLGGAAAGKEAEWLRNLILKILLWSKPISPISIRCDSAATLTNVYSQMFNGKSRHLGVRHSMIRELIMNGVVSIEFVRSQQHLADHLTKGLARDLVLNSVKGIEVTEEVVVQQPEPEHRKSKKNRTPKDFGPKFQLYLIEGIRDDVSYCFNVKDESKTFDEAMKSQDVAFWKEAINDEMDSIMGNNTEGRWNY